MRWLTPAVTAKKHNRNDNSCIRAVPVHDAAVFLFVVVMADGIFYTEKGDRDTEELLPDILWRGMEALNIQFEKTGS